MIPIHPSTPCALRRGAAAVGALAALLLVGAGAAPPAPPSAPPSEPSPAAASPPRLAPVQMAEQAESIGSLRNARVALPRGADAPPLTVFMGALDPELAAQLARVAPRLRMVVGLTREEALRRAGEAHACDGASATPEFLRAAKNLVWIQAGSAGVERWTAMPELASNDRLVLTNMRGVHGPAIADHAFAMLLTLTRDLPVHLRNREAGRWQREGSQELQPRALAGQTLLVVGLGGIGSEIARRGHGFGMRVIATRRSAEGAPSFVERVGRPSELLAMLPEADVVAIAAPLTPETEGLFDAAAFAAMKRGSYLVNVGRGRIVQTEALLAALRAGHLAGACLDVTEPEPLPPEHPLWTLPNVVITPHVSARAELTEERRRALLLENLRRFDAGEPLLNVVDPAAGY